MSLAKQPPRVVGVRLALLADLANGDSGDWELAEVVSTDRLEDGTVLLYVRGDMGTAGTITIPPEGLTC